MVNYILLIRPECRHTTRLELAHKVACRMQLILFVCRPFRFLSLFIYVNKTKYIPQTPHNIYTSLRTHTAPHFNYTKKNVGLGMVAMDSPDY